MIAAEGNLATELVEIAYRISAGDAGAEAALIDRYQRAARAIARRHCRPNETQIEDIVQDVLTDLVNRLRRRQITDPQALPQYLQRSIRNACTAHYRRLARFESTTNEHDPEQNNDPSDFSMRLERSRLVRLLVAELPVARDRELLRRFYLLEESRDDVCRALAIDFEHFRRVVHRARQRLRNALGRTGLDEFG